MSSSGPSPPKIKKLEVEEVQIDDSDKEKLPRDNDGSVASSSDEEEIEKVLTKVEEIQAQLDDLNEKANIEILQIESKYNKLRKPLYEKRSEMLEKIPKFWLKAMESHPKLMRLVNVDIKECLNFLRKLEVEESDDLFSECRIKFTFDENPYFENEELVKEYKCMDDKEVVSSTSIKWKEGKNLVEKSDRYSFFSWFMDNNYTNMDDVANAIKEELWPNAIDYFMQIESLDDSTVDEIEEEEEEESLIMSDDEDYNVGGSSEEDDGWEG